MMVLLRVILLVLLERVVKECGVIVVIGLRCSSEKIFKNARFLSAEISICEKEKNWWQKNPIY